MSTYHRPILLTLILSLAIPYGLAAKDEDPNSEKRKPKNQKEDVEAIGDRDVGKGMNFYSLEKEIALGKSLAQEVERNSKIIDDPVVAEYINRVGQNLVRNSDAKVPFTIKMIDAQEVNAFALPGGFFFVNSGLMMRADSESELAVVMAHEIAHVAARHGTRQATRGQVINLASIPLIFMGGWTGYGIRQAAGFAIPISFMKFSRGMEEEADFLGLQYLYKSGYDPTSFSDFFEKLQADQKRKPGTLSKLFASHPPTGSRIKKTQKSIDDLLPSKPEYVVNTSEFLTVKQRLASVVHRSKPEEDPNRPRLRRTTAGGTVPTDDAEDGKTSDDGKAEEEDRPTLKRR
jgi:predicted Zn-dependent protease